MGRILSIALLFLFLTGCAPAAGPGAASAPAVSDPVEVGNFLLDTYVSIRLYGGDEETAREALELCRQYEAIFSRTDPDSELYRLNRREMETVSQELADVISLGLEYGRLTDGAFDITMGSVTQLWDFHAEEPVLPDEAALAEALTHVGWEKVRVEGTSVLFDDPGTILDLGGIAKGYIADRLADCLREAGAASAIIDLGGNLYCIGQRPDGQDFRVGVRHPERDQSQSIGALPVRDRSVVTSGWYERCFTLDGTSYHHILSPATGWPAETGLASVTIVSELSADGDALSTACFVLGQEAGLALVEALEGVEAVFIGEDLSITVSSGLEDSFSLL